MTTVAFDHQIFTMQRYGGISRNFTRLLEELQPMPEIQVSLPFLCASNAYLRNSTIPSLRRPLDQVKFGLSDRWRRRINKKTQRLLLKRSRFDIFHPTYYNDYFLESIEDRPFILTVVDMIPELFSELFSKSPHFEKMSLIPKASAIICISETTRRDLLRFHDLPPERVHVAYLGAPERVTPQGTPPAVPDDFVLFVGDRWAYKNFARFAEAMRLVMARRAGIHLVCAGGGALLPDELRLFQDAGCLDRVHSLSPDDQTLEWLYRMAKAFVFPSQYEGFGLPILEAFAFGCPTALADTDCFREIAEDAALFFDPLHPAAIADAIDRVLDDTALRQQLVAKGERRVRDFSWRRMAEETAAVYAGVARGH